MIQSLTRDLTFLRQDGTVKRAVALRIARRRAGSGASLADKLHELGRIRQEVDHHRVLFAAVRDPSQWTTLNVHPAEYADTFISTVREAA